MIIVKRIIGILLSLTLIFQSVRGYSISNDVFLSQEETTNKKSVISDELYEEFNTNAEKYRVMIWMEDIDYDKVETMTETITGTTWEKLEKCEKQVYTDAIAEVISDDTVKSEKISLSELNYNEQIMTDRYSKVLEIVDNKLKPVAENINEYILTAREVSKSLYEENNTKIVKNNKITESIEYISKYSPMVIAVLTKEQIEDIANEDYIVGIYLIGDTTIKGEEVVNINDTAINTEDSEVLSVYDYDGYLDYLSATPAHSMGYTGEGVKVGVLDESAVTKLGHDELANSSVVGIYNSDSPLEPTINQTHSVDMVRIICGEYGMAPDCQVYSNTFQINTYDAIETLLDKGVAVINMSICYERESSSYSTFEMWIDHISVSHSVAVVVCAGNEPLYSSYNITQPGLAYNVITVANVDYLNDRLESTSCYLNGNAGAMKPDVSSSGSNVLGLEDGGTSAATATVTGMIAILMEVKPTLVRAPYVVKAIVIASADHIAGSSVYSTSYENKQGAGVVDVMRAITILNRGQYWSNYISSNGTYSYTKNVASGSSKSTFVFVGNKMNIATGNHGEVEYNNQNMPSTTMVIFNSDGIGLSGCGMPNSSVQLVRTNYNNSVKIQITVSNIGNRGMPYAVAWY